MGDRESLICTFAAANAILPSSGPTPAPGNLSFILLVAGLAYVFLMIGLLVIPFVIEGFSRPSSSSRSRYDDIPNPSSEKQKKRRRCEHNRSYEETQLFRD